jgi:hypothetical protein
MKCARGLRARELTDFVRSEERGIEPAIRCWWLLVDAIHDGKRCHTSHINPALTMSQIVMMTIAVGRSCRAAADARCSAMMAGPMSRTIAIAIGRRITPSK